MDIGNQQRVIIVEVDAPSSDRVHEEEPAQSIEAEVNLPADLEAAAAWPLPLHLDPERVS